VSPDLDRSDGDGQSWLTREEWRAESSYHPSPALHAFLLNLVVNHHCEVDMASDQAVFVECGCQKHHQKAIRTSPVVADGFSQRIIQEVRNTFPCCF